jgi:hypothetical protein
VDNLKRPVIFVAWKSQNMVELLRPFGKINWIFMPLFYLQIESYTRLGLLMHVSKLIVDRVGLLIGMQKK